MILIESPFTPQPVYFSAGSLTWKTAGAYSSSMECSSCIEGQPGPGPKVATSSPNRERFPRGETPARATSSWQVSAECRRRGGWAGRPDVEKAWTYNGTGMGEVGGRWMPMLEGDPYH